MNLKGTMTAKPHILIVMHYMELGGAESALLGLLEALDPERVEVDLFIYSHRGELMPLIPAWVNVLPEDKAYACIECPVVEALRRRQLGVLAGRLWAKVKYQRYRRTLSTEECENDIMAFPYISHAVMPFLPSLDKYGEYDLAISFLQPHDIVRRKVRAKKYMAWIHTDYSTVHVDREQELGNWVDYDYVNSISPECTRSFLSIFPELADKIVEIENILPKSLIVEKAEQDVPIPNYRKDGTVTLCSVGRISRAKNYDNIPYVAQKLKTAGLSFHWYIIGPGDHSAIDNMSQKLGVDDVITFLGATSNPYPYIKACDIYVHPSRYEGKSIVVREAQVLCKPVIITSYPTARSQVNDGVDGIICELQNDKIALAIQTLACDRNKQNELASYLSVHDMSGQDEVEKLYDLIKTGRRNNKGVFY